MAEKATAVGNDFDKGNKKLSTLTMWGYSVGTLCDSLTANLYNIFFLVFAINFAGLDPAFAGMIAAVAVLWDGFTDPIIGYLSDKFRASGKYSRRDLMIRALVPFCISFYMLYRIIEASASTRNIYYLGMALLFWTFYTALNIPYAALGAELTNNYDERTKLRMIAHVFTLGGLFVASTFTMAIVESQLGAGKTPLEAWGSLALIYTAIVAAAGIISWIATSKVEVEMAQGKENTKSSIGNPFQVLSTTMSLRSFRVVCASITLYAIGFTTAQGLIVFFMETVLGFHGAEIGMYFAITTIIGVCTIPVVNFVVKKMGRRQAYTTVISIVAVIQMAFIFIGAEAFAFLIAFGVIQGLGHNTFFPLLYALVYDCCDIDAFVNDERREGIMLSVSGLFQKIGYALGTSFAGLLLSFFKYDASLAEQTAETLRGLNISIFVIAPAFFLVGGLIMSRFKINQNRYDALQEALRNKEEGKPYNTDGFKELL